MDTLTNATAGAAVVSPWWLPSLQTAHDTVAFALPFMGAAWILMQAYFKLKDRYWK
jgi:hypothetical protein